MKASIIIPTKDKISRLSLVLKALEHQVSNEVEVVIVFDGCTQTTIKDFKNLPLKYKPQAVILEKNKGRAAARNRGLRAAKGELIIFLDDDRIPEHNFVKLHMEAHGDKDIVVLGRRKDVDLDEETIHNMYKSDNFGTSSHSEMIYNVLRKHAFLSHDEDLKQLNFVRNINMLRWMLFFTGNVSVKKQLVIDAGMFDENFVRWGSEDVDLGIRLYLKGIPFISRKDIVNYHLLHKRDFAQRLKDNYLTHSYLTKKYRRNWTVYWVLLVKKIRFKLLGDRQGAKEV